MRSTTRFIAITAGGVLLAAAAATPVLAQSDEQTPAPGMTHMHGQMMGGHNMGGHNMGGNSMMGGDSTDMARMHDRMMAERRAAEPQPEATP